MAEERVHHVRPHGARERRLRVACLERERVLEQPALKRQVQPRAELWPLRCVDVEVHQPRDQHAARRRLDAGGPGPQQRAAGLAVRRLDRGDQAAVVDGDDRVLDDLQVIRGGGLHEPGGDDERHVRTMARCIPRARQRRGSCPRNAPGRVAPPTAPHRSRRLDVRSPRDAHPARRRERGRPDPDHHHHPAAAFPRRADSRGRLGRRHDGDPAPPGPRLRHPARGTRRRCRRCRRRFERAGLRRPARPRDRVLRGRRQAAAQAPRR